MKVIDINTWERATHYHFFKRMDYPHYLICSNVDVTRFLARTKTLDLPFYYAMIHAAMRVIHEVDAFRYRIRGDEVVLHEVVHPCFSDMSAGSDLFKMVTVNMQDDMKCFVDYGQRSIGPPDRPLYQRRRAGTG